MKRLLPLALALLCTPALGAGLGKQLFTPVRSDLASNDTLFVQLAGRGDVALAEARESFDKQGPPRGENPARRALDAYDHALALREDVEVAHHAWVATSYLPRGVERNERIVRYVGILRRVAPRDPRDDEWGDSLAGAYTELGVARWPAADKDWSKAVAEYALRRQRFGTVDPQEAKARALASTNGAELLMGMGPAHLDQALEWYEESMRLAPEEVLGYYGAAVAHDRAGNPRRALELMREGLRREATLAGDSPCGMERITDQSVFFVPEGDVEFYLGLGCEALGQVDKARAHYNRFMVMLPGSPYLGRARARLAALTPGGHR